MEDKDISEIAAEVSLLMQLDRMRHHVGTTVDMKVLANIPDYIASIFERANIVNGNMTPAESYEMINRRVSRLEAHLYLIRLELENRFSRDPDKLFEDPLFIGAYGERMKGIANIEKSFHFESAILAYGWYPIEKSNGKSFRWMRPVSDGAGNARIPSVACVPHLGNVNQSIEIEAHALIPEQLNGLTISAADATAEIIRSPVNPVQFIAKLYLKGEALKAASHVPITFNLDQFVQPDSADQRMLGINVSRFTCRPMGGVAA